MKLNVFISFSGPRSEHIARGLKKWLPLVIQQVNPWLSSVDIQRGSTWLTEISSELEKSSVGIFCLTPENLESGWLNFEAGAIGIRLNEQSRVCTYLYDIPSATAVALPLGQFQATMANKDETRKLLRDINRWCEDTLADVFFDNTYDKMWGDFQSVLDRVPEIGVGTIPKPREQNEILEELSADMKILLGRDNSSAFLPTSDVRDAFRDFAPQGSLTPNTFEGFAARLWACRNCPTMNVPSASFCSDCGTARGQIG